MRLATLAMLGSLAILASPALSTEPQPSRYLLAMKLHDGDRLVGSPRMQVAAGTTSRIEIGESTGNRYAMSFQVTPQTGETAMTSWTIDVVSSGVHRAISPRLLVALGKPSAMAFGEDRATAGPIRVDFTIEKVG